MEYLIAALYLLLIGTTATYNLKIRSIYNQHSYLPFRTHYYPSPGTFSMGRGGAKKDIPIFLDSIKDEHYENFQEKTYVIKEDKKLGMRLDHQGMNQDGTHRIWIQPLENGTSRNVSKAGTDKSIARVIVTNGAKPADVKQGLIRSERSRTNYEYKVDKDGVHE